jgi:hypothetical protein
MGGFQRILPFRLKALAANGRIMVMRSSGRASWVNQSFVPGHIAEGIMKIRFAVAVAVTFFSGALAMAGDGSWTGYISDSKCGVKGAHEGAAECTTKCVGAGAKYVFVDDATKKVFVVDNQDQVAPHAGHHVTVKGTVDGDTLKLSSIDMAPAKKS